MAAFRRSPGSSRRKHEAEECEVTGTLGSCSKLLGSPESAQRFAVARFLLAGASDVPVALEAPTVGFVDLKSLEKLDDWEFVLRFRPCSGPQRRASQHRMRRMRRWPRAREALEPCEASLRVAFALLGIPVRDLRYIPSQA